MYWRALSGDLVKGIYKRHYHVFCYTDSAIPTSLLTLFTGAIALSYTGETCGQKGNGIVVPTMVVAAVFANPFVHRLVRRTLISSIHVVGKVP